MPVPSSRTTFPQPLPSYLHSNNHIPPVKAPAREPISANAGRFSLSLKGMRKELRKTGPRTEVLVKEIEHEVLSWLGQGIWLSPDARSMNLDPALGSAIGSMGVITEVSRTPSQLVWSIRDDSFVRYVVHCCARYHNIVSFSKCHSGNDIYDQALQNLRNRTRVPKPVHTQLSAAEKEQAAKDYYASVRTNVSA